jgi:hypothetical protein
LVILGKRLVRPTVPAGELVIGQPAIYVLPDHGRRRKLVDKIVLVPGTDDEGHTSLSIDLHGHLAGILSLATKAKRPLNESGLEIGYMKLVAGARIGRDRHSLAVPI